MTAKNDVTGDTIISKAYTDAYALGWERIFGSKSTDSSTPSQVPEPAPDATLNN